MATAPGGSSGPGRPGRPAREVTRRVLDEATRQRRARKALESLEADNFHDDPHADLVMSKKALNLFQVSWNMHDLHNEPESHSPILANRTTTASPSAPRKATGSAGGHARAAGPRSTTDRGSARTSPNCSRR